MSGDASAAADRRRFDADASHLAVIEVRYKARLGNNLFQYALGRILAQGLGYALQAAPIEGFPNTRAVVNGARHDGPEQILTGQTIDLQAVLADRRPRRIILDGWFQRIEYYQPHRQSIREWLRFDPAIRTPAERPGVVLNVRRTDYVTLDWALPFSYYAEGLRAVAAQSNEPLWVVTDDDGDPFFLRFRRQLNFYSGSALEQLRMMASARRLIMSQSTFSWWAAFLGEPDVVVCPLPGHGVWSRTGWTADVDLIDRERFVCLPCPDPYEPNRIEARYQRDRRLRWRIAAALNRYLRLGVPEPLI